MDEVFKIGIAGLGTVGQGVFKILNENASMLEKKCGKKIEVVSVSARDSKKKRSVHLSNTTWRADAMDIATDEDIDLLVELIGGADGVAYEICKAALNDGKHVVTANKAMIAKHGIEIAKLAEENNVALAFEASVAGGIPIIKILKEGLAANNFSRIAGILNGTCNYILSAMKNEKRDFADVLKEAQEKGYAETPPDLDIDGIDAAHKLAILTSIAYGTKVNIDAVYIEGIRNISLDDMKYASELGYSIKLLGISNLAGNKIEQRVHPCLVPKNSSLAKVDGVLNGIAVEGDSAGKIFISGAGAGGAATASAVVADIIDIASGRISTAFGVPVRALSTQKSSGMDEHIGGYYVRLKVKDEPGVLANITLALSEEKIGVEKVLQKANEKNKTAQIALTTHETSEVSIKKALKNVGGMKYIIEPPHMIRIEDI